MAGGGPAADSAGNVYLLAGNGAFEDDPDGSGFPNLGDFGNSFVKLTTAGGTLAVADYFAMYNAPAESGADMDLGSGGTLLLPDVTDSGGTVRHLMVGAGKDGNLYVVNRDSMGKLLREHQQHLAASYPGAARRHLVDSRLVQRHALLRPGRTASLLAFSHERSAACGHPASQSAVDFTYPGTSPAISANGTSNAIVWAHENANPAVLYAFDATNLAHELYNSSQAADGRDQFGPGNKFITPTIADGKVFVGTTNGVAVFGASVRARAAVERAGRILAPLMNFCGQCGAPVRVAIPDGDHLPRHVCDACGTIHYQNPRLVLGCVPEHAGSILLCRRAIEPRRGYWTVPAGFMENGETLQQAAARECLRGGPGRGDDRLAAGGRARAARPAGARVLPRQPCRWRGSRPARKASRSSCSSRRTSPGTTSPSRAPSSPCGVTSRTGPAAREPHHFTSVERRVKRAPEG